MRNTLISLLAFVVGIIINHYVSRGFANRYRGRIIHKRDKRNKTYNKWKTK